MKSCALWSTSTLLLVVVWLEREERSKESLEM
jgi:hypothetical protein